MRRSKKAIDLELMANKIRCHYVPQHYLRRFGCQDKPQQIWVYDKAIDKTYRTAISKAARVRGYYTPEFEEALASEVEGPSEALLRKICNGEILTLPEKWKLAEYFSVMIKRVPATRKKGVSLIPEVHKETMAEFEAEIHDVVKDPILRKRRLRELAEVRERWKDGLPEDLRLDMLQPRVSEKFVRAIYKMKWLYQRRRGSQQLVTSDNPFFYFGGLGLGTPKSEISIPISKDLALIASNSTHSDQKFIDASDRVMREINRRSIDNATRFVYFHEDATWVRKIAKKGKNRLHSFFWP